jgi:hypothetical protein
MNEEGLVALGLALLLVAIFVCALIYRCCIAAKQKVTNCATPTC